MSSIDNTELQIALLKASAALNCKDYKKCEFYLTSAFKWYKLDTNEAKDSDILFYNKQNYFRLFELYGFYCKLTSNSKRHQKAIKSYKKALVFIHMDLNKRMHENYNKIYKQISICYFESAQYIQSLRYCKMINHNILCNQEKYDHLIFILEIYFILEDIDNIRKIIKKLDEWKYSEHTIEYFTVKMRYYAIYAGKYHEAGDGGTLCIANEWFMKGVDLLYDTNTNLKHINDFKAWAQFINSKQLNIQFDPNQSISSVYARTYILKSQLNEKLDIYHDAISIYLSNESFLYPQKLTTSNKIINVPFAQFYFGILSFESGYYYDAKKYILSACKLSPELPIIKEKGKEWREKIIYRMSTCNWCKKQNIKYNVERTGIITGFERECYKMCRRCRNVYYCSRRCQKLSWKQDHRYKCYDNTMNYISYAIGYYKD